MRLNGPIYFSSCVRTQEELEERWERFLEEVPEEEKGLLREFSLTMLSGGEVEVSLPDDDYYGKFSFFVLEHLAKFIAEVLQPGQLVSVEVTDELPENNGGVCACKTATGEACVFPVAVQGVAFPSGSIRLNRGYALSTLEALVKEGAPLEALKKEAVSAYYVALCRGGVEHETVGGPVYGPSSSDGEPDMEGLVEVAAEALRGLHHTGDDVPFVVEVPIPAAWGPLCPPVFHCFTGEQGEKIRALVAGDEPAKEE